MKKLMFFILLGISGLLSAQDVVFKVEVTADTLYFGNPVGVKYTFENIQGDFVPPSFEGFDIVGGPNVSNQFSMINGAVTQSSSYEYYLKPVDVGIVSIKEATIENGDGPIYSDPIDIVVVDNPEGIRQNYARYNQSHTKYNAAHKIPMSKSDSLKMKLRKIKSKKI